MRGTRGREVRAVDEPARGGRQARRADGRGAPPRPVRTRRATRQLPCPARGFVHLAGLRGARSPSIVAAVRAEAPPYAVGRERVRSRAVRAIQLQAERRAGPMNNTWLQKITRARPVTEYVDTVWPKVKPGGGARRAVHATPTRWPRRPTASSIPHEQKALLWARPPRSWKSAKWSAADLVLLDEVAGLIEHPEGYGHIVVDEAQDLSPMQCRAIAPARGVRLADGARRPGPGHHPVGGPRLVRAAGPPGQAGRRGGPADDGVPGAGRDRGAGQPAAPRARRGRTGRSIPAQGRPVERRRAACAGRSSPERWSTRCGRRWAGRARWA